MEKMKSYKELCSFNSYKERLDYLSLKQDIGEETFGSKRYLNQNFYKSDVWKKIRNKVIIRDNGCDLGLANCEINGRIYIHHINPLRPEQFKDYETFLDEYNSLDNLVCCSGKTHNAIHYGIDLDDPHVVIERSQNDTIPWK